MDSSGVAGAEEWDAARVRALRAWLASSQAGLADRLGTRQQTVSQWETGSSEPRRMSRRLLRMVAQETGFYETGPRPDDERPSAGDDDPKSADA